MALSFGIHVAPLVGTASDGISSLDFSDILGASLVTFDRHIPVDAEQAEELDPRGIYIKYQTLDPVTKQPAPLVIPGEFSLDAYLPFDGSFQIPLQQDESPDEVIEEDMASSTQGRRKIRLFSSVKGDPILLRAPTTGSPEAYFSPHLNEGGNWAGMCPGHASRQRPAHANHTLCSFTRAGGRDKFTSPRLAELDSILKARQRAKDGSKPSKRPAPTSVKFGPTQALALSARVAASLVSGIDVTSAVAEATQLENAPPPPRRNSAVGSRLRAGTKLESDTPVEGAGHGTVDDDENPNETKVPAAGKPTADLFGRQASWASATEEDDQVLNGSLVSYELVKKSQPKKRTEPKDLRLRLVDPHLSESAISSAVPKQRLYSNWPEALKKQVARNYYGLRSEHLPQEDTQVAKRERKNTLRMDDTASSATDAIAAEESQYSSKSVRIQQGISGHTIKTAFRPSTPIREKDSSSASSATSARIPRLSPRVAWTPRPGFYSHPSSRPVHGLEIRISGKERVVVGRFSNTKTSQEESATRQTALTCHNFYS